MDTFSNSRRGRAICFIDNSNIFYGQRAVGWKIDWRKFEEYLQRDGLWQTHFFASVSEQTNEIQDGFYNFLKASLRWEVHLYALGNKTVRCSACENVEFLPAEKGIDVGVAIKMLILGYNRAFDTAILVSGDNDYLETVKAIKNLGLRVEIVSWRGAISRELANESSSPVAYLDDLERIIRRD